jgi:plasmid stabilization system protein ParE
MQIKQQVIFKNNLKQIIDYIAKDNISAAKDFRKNLFLKIKELPNMPKKNRKSYYYNEENIRDMIFKGYTIIYEIYNDTIEIQTIFNTNLPKISNK